MVVVVVVTVVVAGGSSFHNCGCSHSAWGRGLGRGCTSDGGQVEGSMGEVVEVGRIG